jgi:hypothetical protein
VDGTLEWGVPVLYTRSPDGVLFDIAEQAAPLVAEPAPAAPVIAEPAPAPPLSAARAAAVSAPAVEAKGEPPPAAAKSVKSWFSQPRNVGLSAVIVLVLLGVIYLAAQVIPGIVARETPAASTAAVVVIATETMPPADTRPAPTDTAAISPTTTISAGMYCVEKGGMLSKETRGDAEWFDVCYFEDNRQCEAWALMRGDCPVGGLKVTGYNTPQSRYCAITGGTYTIKDAPYTDLEQGDCTFKNGVVCDAVEYYYGFCSASQSSTQEAPAGTAEPAEITPQPVTPALQAAPGRLSVEAAGSLPPSTCA